MRSGRLVLGMLSRGGAGMEADKGGLVEATY
jgi:hypothetical protein